MIRHPNRWAPEEIFAAVASALILVVSGYFAVAGVLAPGSVVPGGEAHAARIFAGYLAVRSVLLLGALGWAAAVRHRTALPLLLVLNALVQAGDVAVGVAQHQVSRIAGPALAALVLFAAAATTARGRRGGRLPSRSPDPAPR
jgi:hypothetical protein